MVMILSFAWNDFFQEERTQIFNYVVQSTLTYVSRLLFLIFLQIKFSDIIYKDLIRFNIIHDYCYVYLPRKGCWCIVRSLSCAHTHSIHSGQILMVACGTIHNDKVVFSVVALHTSFTSKLIRES